MGSRVDIGSASKDAEDAEDAMEGGIKYIYRTPYVVTCAIRGEPRRWVLLYCNTQLIDNSNPSTTQGNLGSEDLSLSYETVVL